MNAPAIVEELCSHCLGADEECGWCAGMLFRRVDVGPPIGDARGPLHRWATENARVRIRAALPSRTDHVYISGALANALALNSGKPRAQLVMIAHRFVDEHAELCVRAFVNALSETAANLRAEARRRDGAERRRHDHAAHALERLAERLEG